MSNAAANKHIKYIWLSTQRCGFYDGKSLFFWGKLSEKKSNISWYASFQYLLYLGIKFIKNHFVNSQQIMLSQWEDEFNTKLFHNEKLRAFSSRKSFPPKQAKNSRRNNVSETQLVKKLWVSSWSKKFIYVFDNKVSNERKFGEYSCGVLHKTQQ